MLTKIKLIAAAGGAVAILIIAIALYAGYRELLTLREQNLNLTQELKNINDILAKEIERSNRVEQSTIRLEEQDNARQKEIQKFAGRLNSLARDNSDLRELIDTVVDDRLLDGLRSFPGACGR